MIREITPEKFRKNISNTAESTKQDAKKFQDVEKSIRALSEPTLHESEKDSGSIGYDNSEREAMDTLSNSVND